MSFHDLCLRLLQEISERIRSVQDGTWGDYDENPEYKDEDLSRIRQLEQILRQENSSALRRKGSDLLHVAAAMDLPQTVRFLLDWGVPCSAPDPCGYTALVLASSKDAAAIVQELLKRGADPHRREGEDGVTALHMAGGPETAQILLRAGAKPNTHDFSKNTPLHWAAGLPGKKAVDTARVLLDAGAKVNAVNRDGETPLFRAAWSDVLPDMARLLVERGAHVNHVARSGDTPLWSALFANNIRLVAYLMEQGADANAQAHGETPLQFALDQGMDEPMIQTLLGENENEPSS